MARRRATLLFGIVVTGGLLSACGTSAPVVPAAQQIAPAPAATTTAATTTTTTEATTTATATPTVVAPQGLVGSPRVPATTRVPRPAAPKPRSSGSGSSSSGSSGPGSSGGSGSSGSGSSGGGAVSYKNCTAVKAAGAAPILRGQPGYSAKLDRDGDGVACET